MEEQEKYEQQEQYRQQIKEEKIRKDIQKYLNVFELSYPTTFSEIQKKYKLMLKLYHPDKYSHDPELRAYAEEKTKELNLSFSMLKEYFSER